MLGRIGTESDLSKTSGERGANITVLCCVNAEVRVLAPKAIFKGKKIIQALMNTTTDICVFGPLTKAYYKHC